MIRGAFVCTEQSVVFGEKPLSHNAKSLFGSFENAILSAERIPSRILATTPGDKGAAESSEYIENVLKG